MKVFKIMSAALLLGTLIMGCSSSDKKEEVQEETAVIEPVTKKCTAQMMNMEVKLTLTAPSETEDVAALTMNINIPASFFNLEDLSALTEDMVDSVKPSLSKQMDIPEENISLKVEDEAIHVKITMVGDEIKSYLKLKNDANMAFDSITKELEANDFATCE